MGWSDQEVERQSHKRALRVTLSQLDSRMRRRVRTRFRKGTVKANG